MRRIEKILLSLICGAALAVPACYGSGDRHGEHDAPDADAVEDGVEEAVEDVVEDAEEEEPTDHAMYGPPIDTVYGPPSP